VKGLLYGVVTRVTRTSAIIALAAAAVALIGARIALRSTAGLRAEFSVTGTNDVRLRISPDVSTREITHGWDGAPPPQFRVRWTGYLFVPRGGRYTFATTSDDGSTLAIDGVPVVNNGGDHSVQTRTGEARLASGSHLVAIDYHQVAGEYEMSWSWARGSSVLAPVPSWALWTRRLNAWRAETARFVDPLLVSVVLVLLLLAVPEAWDRFGRRAARTIAERAPAARHRVGAAARHAAPRVAFAIVMLLVALVAAEFVARIWFRSVRSAGDARTYFAGRAVYERLNNMGFRGPDVPARGSRYRIAVVGDSITWGVGLKEDERYTDLVQEKLGGAYEVLNFGLPAHNMPEHLEVLDRVLTVHPDFVLLQLYTNDFEVEDMQRPRPRPLLPWPAADRWLLRTSALYTMVAAQWPPIQEKLGLVDSYEAYMYRHLGDPESHYSRAGFGMLREFFERARSAGVGVGAVMFPHPSVMEPHYAYDYLHDRVQAACRGEHVRCVDLREPFREHFHKLSEIVVSPFDGHPSPAASRVVADVILREFRDSWQPCGAAREEAGCVSAARP